MQGLVLCHHVHQVGEAGVCHRPLLFFCSALEGKAHVLQRIVFRVADAEYGLAVLIHGGKVEVNIRQIVVELFFPRQLQRLCQISVRLLVIQIMAGKEKAHIVEGFGILVEIVARRLSAFVSRSDNGVADECRVRLVTAEQVFPATLHQRVGWQLCPPLMFR